MRNSVGRTGNRVVIHHRQWAHVEVLTDAEGGSRLLKRRGGQIEVKTRGAVKYVVVELDIIGTHGVIKGGDVGLIGREAGGVCRARVATIVIPFVQFVGGWSGHKAGAKVWEVEIVKVQVVAKGRRGVVRGFRGGEMVVLGGWSGHERRQRRGGSTVGGADSALLTAVAL